MANHKENVIREKRTIEATKKNLMGPSGKFGTIIQAFGSPIIRQGTGLMDSSHLEDPYEEFLHTEYSPTISGQEGPVAYRDEILDAPDDFVYQEGMVFDGLSRGMHIEIIFHEAANEITVTYKGYQVYREVAGELECYAPFSDWEDLIERLYRSAKDRVKKLKKYHEQVVQEKVEQKKLSFWQELRMRWGL